ncbi:MAG: alpha/beta fold hydrolase [Anaerolineae bacterium]|nr:alpha/beta fold hydrolase [Anaerolineae bacterium]
MGQSPTFSTTAIRRHSGHVKMEGSPGSPGQLSRREYEILEHLADGLSDQEIADALFLSLNTVKWHNRQIYSKLGVESRTQAIAQARRLHILGPERTGASPRLSGSSEPPAEDRPTARQKVHFTTSFDGTRIAFAVAGSGPPLVKTATFMSHLEYDWESPVWRHWLDALTSQNTLIRYDERGNGLSDWDVEDLSFEAWVRDLEAVVDAAGLQQFPLFAMSQGGTVAVSYTVRHPEKVSHLILYGAYARGWLNRDLTEDQVEEEKLLIDLMRVGWGRKNPAFRQVFATQLRPNATSDDLSALDEQMRISTSSENAARLESEMHRTDIRALAPLVTVPTLILHCREDAAVPFEEGRLLASLIPNAQFIALESGNHLLTSHEPAWSKFVVALRSFLDTGDG